MNIGISKPSSSVREEVPHHLIDIISVEDDFNASNFVSLAERAIAEILDRANTPLIVGGSTMYLYSLLDGIFKGPGRDDRIREELMERAGDKEDLYQELRRVDPESAEKIHSNDRRRINWISN